MGKMNLLQKKISCVINATTEEPNAYLPGVDCVKIRIEDNPYAQICHYFDEVNRFRRCGSYNIYLFNSRWLTRFGQ